MKNLKTQILLLSLTFALVLGSAPTVTQAQDQEVLVNYSLFTEYFKNKDYSSAHEYLQWLLKNGPLDFRGERIRQRATVEYTELAKANAADETYFTAMMDTVVSIYENTPAQLKEAGVEMNEQKWWVDYTKFLRENEDILPEKQTEVPEILTMAFDAAPGELNAYYLKILVYGLASQERKDEAIAFMDRSESSYDGDEDVAAFYAEARNAMFKSPQERMTFLEGRLEKDPGNIEMISELFELYRAMEEADKMEAMGAKLLELEPSARTFRLIAELKYSNGEYDEAIALNDQALGMTDDAQLMRDIYYNKSLAQYSNNSLCGAWRTAKSAMKQDSKFGQGLLLQGDILTRMVSGSGFEREDRAVYWLAADYYGRAKNTDDNLANIANSKSGSIRSSMPDKEAKFFKNWKAGQSFSINFGRYACIGETTTVK